MLYCSLSGRYRTALLRLMSCSQLRASFCRKCWDDSIGSVITIARSLRRRPDGFLEDLSDAFSTCASVGFSSEGERNYERSASVSAKVCMPPMTSCAKCLSNRYWRSEHQMAPNLATAKSIYRPPFRVLFNGAFDKNFDTHSGSVNTQNVKAMAHSHSCPLMLFSVTTD